MVQLKDDCFAFHGNLINLEDALNRLEQIVSNVVKAETLPLRLAQGRFLAETLISEINVPPHNNSAVDGFAVFFNDLNPNSETRLPITGRITAGHPLGRLAKPGEALRVFTGAQMPEGIKEDPDTIFMEEDCFLDQKLKDEIVVLPPGIKLGANRRIVGEDVRMGDTVINLGQRLRPQEIGMAASIGKNKLKVYKSLRVAVFSTGDEVRDPNDKALPGSIFDANRYSIVALLEELGCVVSDLGILKDEKNVIVEALSKAASDHDLIVTSGGVSSGEEDHVKEAINTLGKIHFWRLAIKPGRPIALGQVGNVAFLGLPGNPVAAMVTFMVIGRKLVLLLSGATETRAQYFLVETDFDYKKKLGRREWARVRLKKSDGGFPVAEKHVSSGAGILTSMVEADGLIELDENMDSVRKGTMVRFLPFNEVTGR
ncbi:MAG: gephyrin-like molybdotransferase Glp [Pseudomonadota bacterium]|nr:gephyrin-like molybdotransferase Glp [Pseudomonadota bacterium]